MMIDKALLEAIAKAITGFDITVRLIKPAIAKAAGLCHQSPTGERFIDVNPELSDEKFLHYFLHECGHWKISGGEMRRSMAHAWAANSVGSDVLGKRRKDFYEEEAADALAEHWNSWAQANAHNGLYAINKTVAKAIQLLAYKST